jgi:hypothetical protein
MRTRTLLASLVLTLLAGSAANAADYPVIAYGSRTYAAEVTKSGGEVLVRVYLRVGSTNYRRFGGFTVPAGRLSAWRSRVRSNPGEATAAERVYFMGSVIGSTWHQPSSPINREQRFRIKN